MKTHQGVNQRSLALARAIASKIDQDPTRAGLAHTRATCQRWFQRRPLSVHSEWLQILERPWEEIRETLLDESERIEYLRQNDPFCGILTPQERWEIYRTYHETR